MLCFKHNKHIINIKIRLLYNVNKVELCDQMHRLYGHDTYFFAQFYAQNYYLPEDST